MYFYRRNLFAQLKKRQGLNLCSEAERASPTPPEGSRHILAPLNPRLVLILVAVPAAPRLLEPVQPLPLHCTPPDPNILRVLRYCGTWELAENIDSAVVEPVVQAVVVTGLCLPKQAPD